MAILLEFNYGKRLGLPGYSSHNFGVSVKAEVNNPESIPGEAERVYSILQDSVDSQIVNPGFVPGDDKSPGRLDNDPAPRKPQPAGPGSWKCSQKQTGLILDILDRNNLQLTIVDTKVDDLCFYTDGSCSSCSNPTGCDFECMGGSGCEWDESTATCGGEYNCQCGKFFVGLQDSDVGFDQGGVFNTFWQKTVKNVTALAGAGKVKLRLFSSDTGDSIFDTVVLVDDIEFR